MGLLSPHIPQLILDKYGYKKSAPKCAGSKDPRTALNHALT